MSKKNTWKIIAIIFIILFIIENVVVSIFYMNGIKQINNEYECSNEICNREDVISYYYDILGNYCYCYDNTETLLYYKKVN